MDLVKELPRTYLVALGLHEALRKLGYPSAHIYISEQDGQFIVSVQEGGKYTAFPAGECPPQYPVSWPLAAKTWNAAPADARHAAWEWFQAHAQGVLIVKALVDNGMYPRKGA